MKTPTLETQRLILRPVSLDDAPDLQKHFNNWDIIKHLGTQIPWPYPENGYFETIRDIFLPKIEKGDDYIWIIAVKNNGEEAVGSIHFRKQCEENSGNRGFWIAPAFHGKGYMTEAVEAVNDFVFNTLKIERFVVANNITNTASRVIKEKTGAVYLKTVEHETRSGPDQVELWEMNKENWLKSKEKLP